MPPDPAEARSLSDRLCADGRRFTIRWNDSMGCYRVSTPNLQEAEVVVAAEYDALRAENERLRFTLTEIAERVWWENTLDPQWPARIARARLSGVVEHAQQGERPFCPACDLNVNACICEMESSRDD